jgi:hypothetical protein
MRACTCRFLRKREVLSYQMPAIPCIGPPLSRSSSSSEGDDGDGMDVADLNDFTDYVDAAGAPVGQPPASGRDLDKPDFSGMWLNTSTTVYCTHIARHLRPPKPRICSHPT